MDSKDTHIEGLAVAMLKEQLAGYTTGFKEEFAALVQRPEILALIPAVKALQEENERLSGLSKEHFNKLNEWQAAYIKAERTLLLAGFADEGGELWKPPLGPSASPLLDRIATLEAQLAALQTHLRCMKNEAEVALLGDERMLRDACEEISRIGLEAQPVSANQPDSGKVPPGYALTADDVEWVVNDIAELGVKIGSQFFFLYKGYSLVYEEAKHDDGTPIHWRPVFKREFGECCHPINYKDPEMFGTVSLEDSDNWKELPAAPSAPIAEGDK